MARNTAGNATKLLLLGAYILVGGDGRARCMYQKVLSAVEKNKARKGNKECWDEGQQSGGVAATFHGVFRKGVRFNKNLKVVRKRDIQIPGGWELQAEDIARAKFLGWESTWHV